MCAGGRLGSPGGMRAPRQAEMLCGELDKELHVVKRLRGLIEEKAEVEAKRRQQAEEALAATRLELQRVTSEERRRYLLLEEDHRCVPLATRLLICLLCGVSWEPSRIAMLLSYLRTLNPKFVANWTIRVWHGATENGP